MIIDASRRRRNRVRRSLESLFVVAGIVAVIGSAAAQVEAPSEAEFFEMAQGTWCRLDLHDPATMRVVIPDSADGMMTAVLTSPYATIETEARFVEFIVEDNQVIVTFQGASANKRAHDGSVFTVDFNADFVFDSSVSRFITPSVKGRQAHYSRCAVSGAGGDGDTGEPGTGDGADTDADETDMSGAAAPDSGATDPTVSPKKPGSASTLPPSETVPGQFEPLPADVTLPPLPPLDGFAPPSHRV